MKASRFLNALISGCALAAFVTLIPVASAQINFDPSYTGGPLQIKILGFDMGTLYDPATLATPQGFGAGATGTSIDGPEATSGVKILNGLALANPTFNPATAFPGEDTWGIGEVTTILAGPGLANVVWDNVSSGQNIAVYFYGEKDYYAKTDPLGLPTSFTTNGIGLHADLYLVPTSFNLGTLATLGPGARDALLNEFPGIHDVGSLLLSTISMPGFINPTGVDGGPAAEFQTTYNGSGFANAGQGNAFLSVTGGSMADAFNSNGFLANQPGYAGTTADLSAAFTTNTINNLGWTVGVNDPVLGAIVPVPEASTYGFMGAVALFGVAALRRRSNRKVKA